MNVRIPADMDIRSHCSVADGAESRHSWHMRSQGRRETKAYDLHMGDIWALLRRVQMNKLCECTAHGVRLDKQDHTNT